MKKISFPLRTLIALVLAISVTLPAAADETGGLEKPLESLRPFLGKIWRGEFKKSTPEKPIIDVTRWKRGINGKGGRVRHSYNAGFCGEESIIHWDRDKSQIRYYYFSTAGFNNVGIMTI